MENNEQPVTIPISENDIELLEPWLEEFTTELYTNPVDCIVHEVLTKVISQARDSMLFEESI
mgnify:CR=1 FL=1